MARAAAALGVPGMLKLWLRRLVSCAEAAPPSMTRSSQSTPTRRRCRRTTEARASIPQYPSNQNHSITNLFHMIDLACKSNFMDDQPAVSFVTGQPSVGFALSQLGLATSSRFGQLVGTVGLEPRHFAVLRAVRARDGQSQHAVADRLQIPPST